RGAAAMESESEHPIARGIVKTAAERRLQVPAAHGFRALPGKGVAATGEGVEYRLGGPALLKAEDGRVPPALAEKADAAARRAQSAIYLLRDGGAPAVLGAAGYNVIAIPLAAGVLAGRGILLSPAVGAVLMSASTVIVAVNAQLLKRVRL